MARSFDPTFSGLADGHQIAIHEAVRRHPPEFALGAYHDGELVGMLVCEDEPPNGHTVIVVKPEWRGLGVGRSLLSRMAARARDLGFSRLTVSYGVGNEAAAALLASSSLMVARRVRDGVVTAALFLPSIIAEKPLAA